MPISIKIKYLYNSGFTIEFDDYFIVVDYFKGELVLPKHRKIIFVVTHSHSDHYNPNIFTMKGAERAHYVISYDVEPIERKGKFFTVSKSFAETERKKVAYDKERTYRVVPWKTFEFAGIEWKAFPSTDQGICILFNIMGVGFFHAGDLNAWKWPDTPIEEQEMEVKNYAEILSHVSQYVVDIAFGPLDPRLKENAYLGPTMLIEKLRPQMFIPMHFREDTAITKRFKDFYQIKSRTFISSLEAPGQEILVR